MDENERPPLPTTDVLDWAERTGIEHLKERHESAKWIATQAGSTLTLLLAGVAASLAWAVRLFGSERGPVEWGAAAFCVYLVGVAAVLVQRCMLVKAIDPIYNEPANLLHPGFELAAVRAVELRNIQQRIGNVAARNKATAMWLNRCRLATLASPAVFAAAATVALVAQR